MTFMRGQSGCGVPTDSERRHRERSALREAICDALADTSMSDFALRGAIRSDYGTVSDAKIDLAITALIRGREIRFARGEYVLVPR